VVGDHPVVGVNGDTRFAADAEITGTLVAYGGLGVLALADIDAVASGERVNVLGRLRTGDLDIVGDLSGIGDLQVDGTMRLAGDNRFIGLQRVNALEPLATAPDLPCACDNVFDIDAAVAAAKDANNNAGLGLPTKFTQIGVSDIRLTTGTYYFEDVTTLGVSRIIIDGAVALYIGDDLAAIGKENIALTPGSTLDMYVAGSVNTVGHVTLGDKSAPSSFRLYIGGEGLFELALGKNTFNGSIYAPKANLAYVGDTNIRGAVFARKLTGIGKLVLGYAAPQPPDATCTPGDGGDGPVEEDPNEPPVIIE
jgi:hypothetical protein